MCIRYELAIASGWALNNVEDGSMPASQLFKIYCPTV
jgi:hypothetical protein